MVPHHNREQLWKKKASCFGEQIIDTITRPDSHPLIYSTPFYLIYKHKTVLFHFHPQPVKTPSVKCDDGFIQNDILLRIGKTGKRDYCNTRFKAIPALTSPHEKHPPLL